MYIQLDSIRKWFKDYACSYNITKQAYNLSGFCRLYDNVFPAEYSLHTLYVIEDIKIAQVIRPQKMLCSCVW